MRVRPAVTTFLVLVVLGAVGFTLFRSMAGNADDNVRQWLVGVWDAFESDEASYPIIYAGDAIAAPEQIQSFVYFEPLFGQDRPSVNPADPTVVNGHELIFREPGEYYLLLNGSQPFRVVVLAPDEAISDSVVRVFDFLTANLLVTQGQDKLLHDDPDAYIKQFFLSRDPGLLLCGPTLELFQRLIYDRFRLPVRGVGYTGTFLYGGEIKYAVHNTAEVYLPDKKKWVQFDINNGFLVKWLSALEVSTIVRKVAGSGRALDLDEWNEIDWVPYSGVMPLRSVSAANSEPKFRPELVSTERASKYWPALSHVFVGGPSYRSGHQFDAPGLPEAFDIYYATLHDDPLLVEASRRLTESWNLSVKVVTPAEMEELLEAAFAGQIETKVWLKHIHPDQAKMLDALGTP